MAERFSWSARWRSMRHAWHGLIDLITHQHNARVHIAAGVLAVLLGLWLEISAERWAILIVTIAAVLIAEALNTAVEYLADATIPEPHPLIKRAKDVAAAAVWIAALASVVVGGLIFLPPLIDKLWLN